MSRSPRNTSGISKRIVSAAVTAALCLQLVVMGMLVPETAHALTVEEARQASQRVSAGWYHSLALRADGTVAAWGANGDEQCDVPVSSADSVAVAAGGYHSLALRSDGTVDTWGWSPDVPDGLTGVTAIAAGVEHSLALKDDGTVVAWGSNGWGQLNVPAGLDGVVAISAGDYHSLALKADGTVVAWGLNNNGQSTVPGGINDAVAIAAGGMHSLAVRSNGDGTVVSWGRSTENQRAVPAGLSGVVSVAAGNRHSLAVKADGTVVAWGGQAGGQVDTSVNVPSGLKDVVAVDGGFRFSLARKSDGTVVGWGDNTAGQCFGVASVTPPSGASGVATDAPIAVRFSAPAAAGSNYTQITLKDSKGSTVAITRSLIGDTLTIQPTAPLTTDNVYTLTLPAGSVTGPFSTAIPGHTSWFATADTRSPAVTSVNPPNGAASVAVDTIVRVYFDEDIVPAEQFGSMVLTDGEGRPVPFENGIFDRYVWIRPLLELDLGMTYTLTVPAGSVEDLSGNAFATTLISSFKTAVNAVSIEGSDRYLTAIAGSAYAFPQGSSAVVIATGEGFADALGGAALAGALDAPLLITRKDSLPASVAAEIVRLGATKAYILGGTGAVSDSVAASVSGALAGPKTVTRIAGANRYDTADLVAAETISLLGPSYTGGAFVATGEDFPDALGASSVAAAKGMPVILAHPARTSVTLPPQVTRVVIAGGTGAVPAPIETSLKSALGQTNATRLAGLDRYDTAARVAAYGARIGMTFDGVGIATGTNFPDALAAGPVLGTKGALMLLTGATVPAPTSKALSDNKAAISTVHFFGGTGAVPLSVRQTVLNLVN
jgi:putative cell wall-binding protein